MRKTRFEFLNISKSDKELITKLSPNSDIFYLAPLDKGLSGSITLLAKWYLGEKETKFHVLKIGNASKLKAEYEAINEFAAPIIKNFPHAVIKYSDDAKRAVLCQEFIGNERGINKSLKQFIEQTNDLNKVEAMINSLYKEEIRKWIPSKSISGSNKNEVRKNRKQTTYGDIFSDWISKGQLKGGLREAASKIGEIPINESLYEYFGLNLDNILSFLEKTHQDLISIKKGPVHGDLHAQNIVLDTSNKICLIDFGWTNFRWQAVDFIWLECSLKFVVCTPYIRVKDFILIENLLNEFWENESSIPYEEIKQLYYGNDIAKIVKGIATIRENARDFNVISNQQEYLKGLIIMTSSLSTFPQLNRGNLFHSLGANISKLTNKKKKVGTYDELYKNSEVLWTASAGRMVKAATEIMDQPGKCLDIGCGDGKNMFFLENLGWDVEGVDISKYAIDCAYRRYTNANKTISGRLVLEDAVEYQYLTEEFDLVVCYGLYHCLTDEEISKIHTPLFNSLKKGGLLAFATMNNELPIPENHKTGEIYLRDPNYIFDLVGNDFSIIKQEFGEITESHPPLVDEHKHSLTWALFQKT